MSRQAIITQEELNAAANRIRDAGGRPTNRSLYEALGSRGSMGTVTRLFAVWLANQECPSKITSLIPIALQKSLVDFVANEVTVARAANASELETLQESNLHLIEESERASSIIAEQSQVMDNLKTENAQLTGRLGQMNMVAEEFRRESETQRQSAEAARIKSAKAELRLSGMPRLEADLERLRASLDVEHAARVDAEQSAAVAAAKLEKTAAEASDLDGRLIRAEADARDASEDRGKLRQRMEFLEVSFEAAMKDVAKFKEAASMADAAAASLNGQLLELRNSNKTI